MSNIVKKILQTIAVILILIITLPLVLWQTLTE